MPFAPVMSTPVNLIQSPLSTEPTVVLVFSWQMPTAMPQLVPLSTLYARFSTSSLLPTPAPVPVQAAHGPPQSTPVSYQFCEAKLSLTPLEQLGQAAQVPPQSMPVSVPF